MSEGKFEIDSDYIVSWSSDGETINTFFVPTAPGGVVFHQRIVIGSDEGGGYTSFLPDASAAVEVIKVLADGKTLPVDYVDQAAKARDVMAENARVARIGALQNEIAQLEAAAPMLVSPVVKVK